MKGNGTWGLKRTNIFNGDSYQLALPPYLLYILAPLLER